MKRKVKRKAIKIVIIIVSLILLILGILFGLYYYFNPYRESLTSFEETLTLEHSLSKEEATDDLTYMINYLKRYHPAYLDGSNDLVNGVREQFEREIESLGENVPVVELWQSASRIIHNLNDAHSRVGTYSNSKKYISDFNEVNQYRLVSIDGIEVSTLYEKFLLQFSYELESYAKYQFDQYMKQEDYLKFLDINTTDGVIFNFETDNGLEEFYYEFVTSDEVINTKSQESNEFVYYEIDKNNNIGFFILNECRYNDTYKDVLEQFFNEIKEHNIDNVVVDLRKNSGGNSIVINKFLEYIAVDSYYVYGNVNVRYGPLLIRSRSQKNINNTNTTKFSGSLYAITSTNTFSAAMDFAMVLSDNKIGRIIGEIPGNMPSCYGDILSFQMPNSKLPFVVSYKYFERVDSSKGDLPLIPDYEVKSHDAIEKVYEIIKGE